MRVPSVIGRRATAVTVGIVLLVGVIGGGWAYQRHRARTVDDAAAVWCLATDQQAQLVDAAKALGAVRPESTEQRLVWSGGAGDAYRWRGRQPVDFVRSCRALIGAQRRVPSDGEASPWSGFTSSVLLAVISAGVAAWFSRRLTAAGHRRTEAEELRAAARAYRSAVERLVRELELQRPGTVPDEGEVQDRRLALATLLEAVATTYRRWPLPGALRQRLDREPLGGRLTERWASRPVQQRAGWAADVRSALDELEAEVAQVARVVAEPGLVRPRSSVGRP